jgi:predicted DNA-binding protein
MSDEPARMKTVSVPMPLPMAERLEALAASRFCSTAAEARRAIATHLDLEAKEESAA